MSVRYVYDEDGKKESVIIPYKMWQRIRPAVVEKKSDFDPDEYRGIYKDLALNWDEESRSLRDEWDRDII